MPALLALAVVAARGRSPDATRAAMIFNVSLTTDSGAGSLRAAILAANANPGTDTISFSVGGGGAQTISPASSLPALTDPVIIDGTTQPGFAGTPLIQLSGVAAGPGLDGLIVTGGNSTVRGLIINGFVDAGAPTFGGGFGLGIRTHGSNVIAGNIIGLDKTGTSAVPNAWGIEIDPDAPGNTIGGTTAADRNIISGNLVDGVDVFSASNTIQGNYIGLSRTGTASIGNGRGVTLEGNVAHDNVVGGVTASAANVISGNDTGVNISTDAFNNRVQGNDVGTNATVSGALANFEGICVCGGSGNVIGGSTAARNVIADNTSHGIDVNGSSGNEISSNYIGVLADGATAAGNGGNGVAVSNLAMNNVIGGPTAAKANVIAQNGGNGVQIGAGADAAGGNSVVQNAIFGNGGLGIDLLPFGETPIDPGDADSGANNDYQNFPVVTQAVTVTSTTSISVTFNGKASSTVTFHFYASTSCDASGFGEGHTFLGSQAASTNTLGDLALTFVASPAVANGQAVTATATSATGDTSEFSRCTLVATPAASDIDGDGCSDARELAADPLLGGARDPSNPWDFFDVPVPVLTESAPNGTRGHTITLSDVIAILYYIGTTVAAPDVPNGNNVTYGSDLNHNGLQDGMEYDRAPSTDNAKLWRASDPNGVVSLQDAVVALRSVGANCS